MTLIAQDLNGIQSGANINAPADVGTLITNILPYIFSTAGILLLIYLILGGFQLMTSKGDPKAVSVAQAKITAAIIGFVLVFLSIIILKLVGQILGIGIFNVIF